MSIAADEALEWHGLHGDENGDRDSSYSADEMDDAYIAGRTAEPTEAEIEAAAHRLYEITHAPEADPGWYAISEEQRNTYRKWSEPMLTATRKAVAA